MGIGISLNLILKYVLLIFFGFPNMGSGFIDKTKNPQVKKMDLLFCQTPQQKEAAIKALQDYLPHCRWFSSKSQSIVQLEFEEEIFLDPFKQEFSLLFFRVTYDKGPEAQDLFL